MTVVSFEGGGRGVRPETHGLRFGGFCELLRWSLRKAILSAFLLLCSHGKKNDTAMLRKFLRKVLGISVRLRKSLRKVLGILDLPKRGSRVLCTCTADIVLHACSAVRDDPDPCSVMCMREELPSLELLLS